VTAINNILTPLNAPMKKNYMHAKKNRLLSHRHNKYFLLVMLATFSEFIPFDLAARISEPVLLPAAKHIDIQVISLSGKVTDENGASLPGVSIIEKGTTNGTVSDSDGKYRLTVSSAGSVLVFSFVGSITQQITVGAQTEINIKLESDVALLSEVVVVGYGTQEKRDVTGAVGTVKSENFNKGIINSPEQLLQGKIAGVNVTSASGEPGGAQSITIRGPGGVRTGSTPLFVVDGMALDNSSTSGGGVNPLNFLNPQDIESIDVLKDASATAIYGARGANGVVLITTKKGKAGTSSITYSANIGISKLARPIDVFTADEFRQQISDLGVAIDDQGGSTDWQKEISRTGVTQNHTLTFGGGADKLTYYASLGLQDQEGILKNSNMKRYTGRINVSQKFLNDRLSVDLNLNATNTINERPPIESIIGGALSMNPTYPAYDLNGEAGNYPNVVSPLINLKLNKDIITVNRVIGNISPSLTIIKGLVYRLNFGVDNSNSVRDIQSLPSLQPAQPGRLESQYKKNTNTLIENYITYTRSSGDHSFSALIGHSYQKFSIQNRTWSINKFNISDIEPMNNPGLGLDLTLTNNKPTGATTLNELQSFFGRVTYEWKGKYLATATLRADGSSKFGENNKYGTFPSFSLGWRLSEEEFMKSLPLSNLKLRAGWGKTGNQEIPNKITKAVFTSQIEAGSSYPLYAGTYPAGTTYGRLANPNIQWEVSTQTNVGLDFGFLNGALSGSIDYFNKQSNNILLEVIAPDPVQPQPRYWTNVEDMKITNSGVEVALNYQFKTSANLTFNVGGNITFIHNIVENSPYSVIPSGTATGSGLTSATINGYVNGQPIGTFFLKEFTGFDGNGISTYADNDGDGYITDHDRIAAGSALPTQMYNFFASAAFKGFDITANFNGVSGNKLYDNTANANFYKLRLSKSLNTTNEAVANPEESINNAASVSTRYLKNGSFLRLNNLSLGYNFNTSSLKINNWIKSLRLSVTGQNLFVITKYNGYDPEVNTDRTIDGATSYGIDYQSYPKAKTVVFGLNVTF
jgi:TonB-linked SusC/RagA family outer membrane protein